MKQGIYELSNKDYHADPCSAPSLSAGIASTLIRRSPAHAWAMHPKNPAFEPENKQQWDLGSAAHAMLFDENSIVEIAAKDYRTNDAKAARDLAYASGKIPVLTDQRAELAELVHAIRAQIDLHETDSDAFKRGRPEVSLVWREPNGVWCRCRPDYLHDDHSRVDHLKTSATSMNPASVARWAMDQGHDFIDAFYRRGCRAVLGKDVPGLFIAVENSAPFGMSVYTLPKIVQEMADEQVELAIRTWAACLKSKQWPCYPLHRIELDPPPWATAQWEIRRERAKFPDARKFDPILSDMLNTPINVNTVDNERNILAGG